jgi:hypothetical protein
MSKKAKVEDAPADTKVKARKRKPASLTPKAKPVPPNSFDFIGKVEGIVVKSGADAEVFEFNLRGRDGARQTFRLKASDSFALNIMASIVTAAHATEAKIGVRIAPQEGGIPYVIEVASRPRLGKET